MYKQSNDGHYLIPTNKDSIEIEVAMPEVGPIAKAIVYITAKNAFFDTFSDNAHDAVEKTVTVPINRSHPQFKIDARERTDSFTE